MWQKPLLLGDKNRNIVAIQPKKHMRCIRRYACITPHKLGKIHNFCYSYILIL